MRYLWSLVDRAVDQSNAVLLEATHASSSSSSSSSSSRNSDDRRKFTAGRTGDCMLPAASVLTPFPLTWHVTPWPPLHAPPATSFTMFDRPDRASAAPEWFQEFQNRCV